MERNSDWDGRLYSSLGELQHRIGEESLDRLTLLGDQRVLDVGCGDGYLTSILAERLPEGSIIGIDPSPAMIEQARASARPLSAGPEYMLGDIRTATFSEPFDLAVSFNVLHWIVPPEDGYAAIRAALSPGGRALLQFVSRGDEPAIEDVLMQITDAPRWRKHFAGFSAPFSHPSAEHFTASVEALGFSIIELESGLHSWQFDSQQQFTDWLEMGCAAWLQRLPAASRGEFVHDAAAQYSAIAGDGRLRFMQLRALLVAESN